MEDEENGFGISPHLFDALKFAVCLVMAKEGTRMDAMRLAKKTVCQLTGEGVNPASVSVFDDVICCLINLICDGIDPTYEEFLTSFENYSSQSVH